MISFGVVFGLVCALIVNCCASSTNFPFAKYAVLALSRFETAFFKFSTALFASVTIYTIMNTFGNCNITSITHTFFLVACLFSTISSNFW